MNKMKIKSIPIGYSLLLVIALTFVGCSLFSTDHFIGTWVQVTDISTNPLNASATPVILRISKQDLFYLVECSGDNGRTFKPYPDQSGRYELSNDNKSLNSVAFGNNFTILYPGDADAIHETAWFGYFKKK